MIHTTQEFLEKLFAQYPEAKAGKVLDVGSLDVNGNLREYFKDLDYTGVDFREGSNVDVVVNGHDLLKRFGKEGFDLVVCFDTLEHDNRFWETIFNMHGVLRPGGYLVLGAPSLHHPRHNHPYDYYRFFGTAFRVFLEGFENVRVEEQCYSGQNDDLPDQVFGWGKKP